MEKRTEKIKWWIRNKIREILTLISVNLCKIETKVDKWGWWEKLKEKYVRNRNKITSIQIGMIVLIGYYMDKELFIEKLKSVIIITMIILGIKYMYEGVLRYFGWDGKKSSLYDREWGENVWEYFQKNQRMKKLGIIILKYIHIYRIILIMRNKIVKGLRYVRYVMIKNEKVYKNWVKVERVGTKIITFIVFEYISRMLIGEVYLEIKKEILGKKLKEIIRGRIQLFWLIGITKGVIAYIIIIMIIKLIELIMIKIKIWVWMTTKCDTTDISRIQLNHELMMGSYILEIIIRMEMEYFTEYWTRYLTRYVIRYCDDEFWHRFAWVEGLVGDFVDEREYYWEQGGTDFWYGGNIMRWSWHEPISKRVLYWENGEELRYMDIYKGINMQEIGKLNYLIRRCGVYRLHLEYLWRNVKNKKKKEIYGEGREKLQQICDEITKVMRKLHEKKVEGVRIAFILRGNNYKADFTGYQLEIYIIVEKQYIKKVREIGEEISLEKNMERILELWTNYKSWDRENDKYYSYGSDSEEGLNAREYFYDRWEASINWKEVWEYMEGFFPEILKGDLKSMWLSEEEIEKNYSRKEEMERAEKEKKVKSKYDWS